ncbi:MAG TPA: TldD/PmbA family protein [Candidatus Aminicenantes bacterium]|nr:TldD/PmbA family protein [Candidatus Aminicenantes bacterium]
MTSDDPFGLAPADLRAALEAALSGGGEFAEVFLERRSYDFINMEEDIVKETAESVGLGLGVRVLRGDRTGFGYTNDLSPDAVRKAALTAAAVARGKAAPVPPVPPLRRRTVRASVHRAAAPASGAGLRRKIGLVREAHEAARKHDPRVAKVAVRFSDSLTSVCVANSEGLLVRDVRPMVKLVCAAIAEKDGRRESGYWGGGGRVGLEYFRDVLTPRRIGEEAAREAVTLLGAADAPAGEMPVVLAPGHSGVLIHEAVGHLLEADFNRKRTSIFWNKMGRAVGSPLVTIYDDPTIPAFRGSYNIDDEGTRPRKTLLIEKGVVRGLLQDRLSARLMRGAELTGHGRRQDYSHWPLPRMANTYIDAGGDAPEDIVRSVRKGLYVASLSGGQVEDSGKFTFSISLGYLIEDGRLTAPVRQATLIGTNTDILKRIDRVGGDLGFGLQTGTCSKDGQDVPVTDGCPTLRVSAMTVGGTS